MAVALTWILALCYCVAVVAGADTCTASILPTIFSRQLCPALQQPGIPVGTDTFGEILSTRVNWHLPGIEHVAQGFDIFYGEETGHPIIDLQYCSTNASTSASVVHYVYRGNVYQIPKGVHIIATPQCSLSASTKMYSYTSSMALSQTTDSTKSATASVKGHYAGVHASVSGSYSKSKSVQQATSMAQSGKVSLAVSTAQCLTYKFEWKDSLNVSFGNNYLHPDFALDLFNMKSEQDALALVQKYGTHFYASSDFGGKLEKISTISDSFMQSHTESSVSSAMSASLSADVGAKGIGYSVSASASGSLDETGTKSSVDDSSMQENSQSSSVNAYGGSPFDPSADSFSDWATTIDTLPVALNYRLEEILHILPQACTANGQNIRTLWLEGVSSYYLENGAEWVNDYVLSLETLGVDHKVYGPYAYFLPEVMDRPQLLNVRGSNKPHYFTNGILATVDVPLKKPLTGPVDYIDLYSLKGYFSTIGHKAPTDSYGQSELLSWPLDHVSLFDSALGVSYLFKAQNFDPWTPDHGRLYRVARTFYKIELEMATPKNYSSGSDPNKLTVPFTGVDLNTGLLQVTLHGSTGTITEYFDLSDPHHTIQWKTPINTLRIFSSVDIGAVASIDVIPILVSRSFSLLVSELRVTHLNDLVYTSDIPNYAAFAGKAPSGVPDYSQMVDDVASLSHPVLPDDNSTLSALLTPYGDQSAPIVNYAYVLSAPNTDWTLEKAQQACLSVQGVLSSPSNSIIIRESNTNWCARSWAVEEGGVPMCTPFIGSDSTACTAPQKCSAVCVGPLPSLQTVAALNLAFIGIPLPLSVSFGSNAGFAWNNDTAPPSEMRIYGCGSFTPTAGVHITIKLMQDITTNSSSCIVISKQSSNTGKLTFDGQGHTIEFGGDLSKTSSLGIDVYAPYTIVKDTRLVGWSTGIVVESTATNCQITDNIVGGVFLSNEVPRDIFGIQVQADNTAVTVNRIGNINGGKGNVFGIAIYPRPTQNVVIDSNSVTTLLGGITSKVDESIYDQVIGIYANASTGLIINNNAFRDIVGITRQNREDFPDEWDMSRRTKAPTGDARAIAASAAMDCTISNNVISGVFGGPIPGPTYSIGPVYAKCFSVNSGTAMGIVVVNVRYITIRGNTISNIYPGEVHLCGKEDFFWIISGPNYVTEGSSNGIYLYYDTPSTMLRALLTQNTVTNVNNNPKSVTSSPDTAKQVLTRGVPLDVNLPAGVTMEDNNWQ